MFSLMGVVLFFFGVFLWVTSDGMARDYMFGLGENAEALTSVALKGFGALAMLFGGVNALMGLVGLIRR